MIIITVKVYWKTFFKKNFVGSKKVRIFATALKEKSNLPQ